jgi:hypothetical protein
MSKDDAVFEAMSRRLFMSIEEWPFALTEEKIMMHCRVAVKGLINGLTAEEQVRMTGALESSVKVYYKVMVD